MSAPSTNDASRTGSQQPSLMSDLIEEHDRTAAQRASSHATEIQKRRLWIGAVAAILIIACLVFIARQFAGFGDSPGAGTRTRVAIDAETGDVFMKFHIRDGQSLPWPHPRSGKLTVYPAESCHWTKDGQAKIEPTYVLLNELIGSSDPTVCPDCGRRVVPHNPLPPMELMEAAANRAAR